MVIFLNISMEIINFLLYKYIILHYLYICYLYNKENIIRDSYNR